MITSAETYITARASPAKQPTIYIYIDLPAMSPDGRLLVERDQTVEAAMAFIGIQTRYETDCASSISRLIMHSFLPGVYISPWKRLGLNQKPFASHETSQILDNGNFKSN